MLRCPFHISTVGPIIVLMQQQAASLMITNTATDGKCLLPAQGYAAWKQGCEMNYHRLAFGSVSLFSYMHVVTINEHRGPGFDREQGKV